MPLDKIPRVGIGVLLLKEKGREVLLGKKIGSQGANTWAPPGGEKRYQERAADAALRILMESIGFSRENVELIDKRPVNPPTEDFFINGPDYTTLWIRARYIQGDTRVIKPEEHETWGLFRWGSGLPNPLFLPLSNLIKMEFNPYNGSENGRNWW